MVPIQCRLARTALSWGVLDLAKAAGVSPDTVSRFERGEEVRQSTLAKLRTTCEKAGVVFIDEDGGGPGVRLARPKRKKSR
jgi:transcriptional regulator with XRE-family HTH domain